LGCAKIGINFYMSVDSSQSNRWTVLALLALAQFMVVLDVSIMNVALPSIGRGLSIGISGLQALVTAYTLLFGGFLLLGGRAADLYGRRRIFLSGVVGFTLASFFVGFANSEVMLIVVRGIQGLAGAFMSPAALSILLTTFHGEDRNRALSIWGAIGSGGAMAGLLIGGVLTQFFGWQWDFYVNIPVGILVVILSLRFIPAHSQEESDKNLDLPGAVLITGGLMLLVYTLSHAASWGWLSSSTTLLLGLSAVLLAAFVFNESRAKHPLVPLSVFKIRNIAGANITQLPITASLFSMFFFLSLYIQNVLHYSPLRTGFSFLPVALAIGASATFAPTLIKKLGFKPILVGAPLLLAIALCIFAQLPAAGGSYWFNILPPMLIMAVGLGMSFVALTIAATSGVPGHISGLASGLITTAQQIGGALGLSILSGVAATATASALASGYSIPVATVSGFHASFYVGAGFAVAASILSVFLIHHHRGVHDDAEVDATAPVL
jgi:EmrB/QacA subfamily drug resistance transporter